MHQSRIPSADWQFGMQPPDCRNAGMGNRGGCCMNAVLRGPWCPILKMRCENARESLRRPPDQIGNLPVANLDNAKLTVGSLHDVYRVKGAVQALCAFMDNSWHLACRCMRHA